MPFPSWLPTSQRIADEAEKRLLDFTLKDYDLKKESCMNTLIAGPIDAPPLLLVHGFGTGLGIWYRNLAGLTQHFRVYAVDWLNAASGAHFKTTESTEDYFVELLEKWRKEHQLERFTLVGHSLGGYMSAVYALKYPDVLERLILVSPAGVPRPPEETPLQKKLPFMYRAVRAAWNMDVTPQGLLRWAGPYGPSLVRLYTDRRFAHLQQSEREALHGYIYHNATRPYNHTYLSKLLAPGAFARKPLCDRLPSLKMPTAFMYGVYDWMDHQAAQEARTRMEVPTELLYVKHAGHQLYLENPVEFNESLIYLCNCWPGPQATQAAALSSHLPPPLNLS